MGIRDVLVRFRATVDGFTTPVDRAKASVEQLRESTEKAQAWDKMSTGALAAGAAITAGLGFAVKAAMDWESAWTGVLKTVDASPAQFAALEEELKELARTLPASATEIAAVAENAGQLGIRADDIGRFTRTMINLGEATNLTSDEAATAIAQIANVMGTAGEDIDRFGAALVALGNDGASTERDIVQMAQRIAASGKLVGLSETDILAYASALSSVGIEAEAGGTAISQSFTQISNAVDQGGQKLTTIARTAGMTADQFAKAWGDDAATAMATFVTGLSGVEEQGGSAARVLDDLGMTGIRQKNALLSLATSGDLLTNSLRTSNEAWSENTALVNEAARRYETTESRLQMAANTATQAAASLGEQLLPVLAGLADGAAKVAEGFGQLPGPLKSVIAYGGAFAGIGLLGLGTAMKLAAGLGSLKAAVTTVGESFPKLSAKMGAVNWTRVAVGAGVAMAAIAALTAVFQHLNDAADDTLISAEGVASGLTAVGKAGVGLAPVQLQMAKLNEALEKSVLLGGRIGDYTDPIYGLADALTVAAGASRDTAGGFFQAADGFLGMRTEAGLVKAEVDKVDAGLAQLASGGSIQQAQVAFSTMAASWEAAGNVGREQLLPAFAEFGQALTNTAGQMGITNLSAAELAGWMGGTIPQAVRDAAAANPELVAGLSEAQQAMIGETTAADDNAAALQAMAEQTRSAAMAQIEASGSAVGWHQVLADTIKKLDDVKVSVNKARTEINLNTKAGRDNQETLNRLAGTALNTATAMEKSGASTEDVNRIMTRSRSAFVEAATKMGLTKKAANELADSYGLLPEAKSTEVKEKGAKDAKTNVDKLDDSLEKLPTTTTTKVEQKGASWAKSSIDSVYSALRRIDGKVATSYVKTKTVSEGAATPGTLKAGGGWVFGPGTWTSDSILAALSNQEYVLRASRAVAIESAYPGFLDYLNSAAPLGRYANGGSPTPASFAPAERYLPASSPAPVIIQEGPRLTIGTLTFEPDGPDELRLFTEFVDMAARKAAVGL